MLITEIITFILSNMTLTFLVLGLVASLLSLALHRRPWTKPAVIEALTAYFLLFNLGLSFLYNTVMHTVFAAFTAKFIGWANSPFQYEVAFASLGFSIVGFLAFRRDPAFRTAAILGPTFFLWGAAGGHIYQMVTAHNFAPGNAGLIFWTDIFLPVIGLTLVALSRRFPLPARS